jgi:hypothetical protein
LLRSSWGVSMMAHSRAHMSASYTPCAQGGWWAVGGGGGGGGGCPLGARPQRPQRPRAQQLWACAAAPGRAKAGRGARAQRQQQRQRRRGAPDLVCARAGLPVHQAVRLGKVTALLSAHLALLHLQRGSGGESQGGGVGGVRAQGPGWLPCRSPACGSVGCGSRHLQPPPVRPAGGPGTALAPRQHTRPLACHPPGPPCWPPASARQRGRCRKGGTRTSTCAAHRATSRGS